MRTEETGGKKRGKVWEVGPAMIDAKCEGWPLRASVSNGNERRGRLFFDRLVFLGGRCVGVIVVGVFVFEVALSRFLFHAGFEFVDASSHVTHQTGQFCTSKQEDENGRDDDHFGGAKTHVELSSRNMNAVGNYVRCLPQLNAAGN